jgi:hypothetical protein
MGLVPDMLCADFAGAFRNSLPSPNLGCVCLAAVNQRDRRFPIFESHTSLLAISSSRFARSTSFCEMPPAS